MAQGAMICVTPEQTTHAVCVLGTESRVDVFRCAPKGCSTFGITASPEVVVKVAHSPPLKKNPKASSKWPLDPALEVTVNMNTCSQSVSDQKVWISYFGAQSSQSQALLCLTGVEISLLADITRTGKVTPTRAQGPQGAWAWGPSRQGAILLVNCDKDNPKSSAMDFEDDGVHTCKDLQDMSMMILNTKTPQDFFTKCQLVLHVAESEMDKVRVFQSKGGGKSLSRPRMVLGPKQSSHALQLSGGQQSAIFHVEGLAFPDASFPGLISLGISLLDTSNPETPEVLVFQDHVTFRVAPWIMTPNTQPPQEVYVCSFLENKAFLKSLRALAKKAKCKLIICPEAENNDDKWMQDEMEIGYIQAPHKILPVVFDSPRNRGLKDFPINHLLGPDFGYVARGTQEDGITSLDSFGNLEVSPPVTVGKKEYPLGRILIGSHSYPSQANRDMHQTLQDFLAAQRVQAPVKLYSDWLSVGHIDEFLSFVPAQDQKGFRLLLASPRACYKLFQELEQDGHGEAVMFEGVRGKRQQKIKSILSNKKLREHNSYVESCIDWNREVLKRELGLTERDIIDIPQFYELHKGPHTAGAFFPNMVNMLVLGRFLGIPKPFGPLVNGRCCLEEKVRSLLEPLGLHCTFIDDFTTYHMLHGEVHCGTNVRRQPFPFPWWNMEL
ncbi:protein-arginine deiminase type-4-like [Tenrec ecaudatus]|uniref:protein-arginine deiminase type-4-like n=1 Tax=Tenrec ecaudatus TaxID=94439 RepID=UPI003F5A0BED